MFSLLSRIPFIARSSMKVRIILLTALCLFIYSTTLAGLILTWYKIDTTVPFHWFDDSKGWLFIDKFGHFFTAFIECSILTSWWCWSGLPHKKCLIIASCWAFFAQSSYEIFDGLSAGYGASITDIIANGAGVLVVCIQFFTFKKLILFSKLSFHPTHYAPLRPEFFGTNAIQQFLKDYNGQTFWFTLDFNGLLKRNILPSWLYITVGYGADGMLGGDDNIWTDKNQVTHDFSNVTRSSRLLLSIDFNWDKIKNKRLHALLYIFNYVKFPAPTIEFHFHKGLRFHFLYF